MPTGYTAGVSDGTITEFKDYALQCARAFGATIDLREEPLSPDIPEFEPSNYHKSELEKAQTYLFTLECMDSEEITDKSNQHNLDMLESYNKRVERNNAIKKRYARMLAEARKFSAPTSEHEEYSKFLVSQLEDSIKFDVHEPHKPDEISSIEWHENALEAARRDVDYHAAELKKEIDRTAKRNEWVAQLKKALNTA